MYYLQLNGTSDKIQVPSLTFDKVIFDVVSRKAAGKTGYLIDARTGTTGYLYSDTSLNEQFAAFKLYVNDVQYTSGTNAIPANTRATVRLENPTVGTDDVTLFARYTGIQYLQADLYDVKFYNGATLVAHYDMSTQTVIDQSGNGNHATLTGGTWVQDGGTPTGTDVNYPYATKQSIYADRSALHALKQAIYADRQNQFPTNQAVYADRQAEFPTIQAVYADRSFSYSTKQAIYAEVSAQFATRQNIYADYVLFSASYPLKQIIYADKSVPLATKQSIYADKMYVFATTQRFYDPSMTIIGRIQLEGERVLYVYLVGERQLNVSLEGGLDLKTNQNFSMVSGDTRIVEVTVDGVDLSGATVKWLMHAYGTAKVTKETPNITITILSVDPPISKVSFTLETEDTADLTGVFSHEMQVTDAVGNVSTVMSGKVMIEKGYIV